MTYFNIKVTTMLHLNGICHKFITALLQNINLFDIAMLTLYVIIVTSRENRIKPFKNFFNITKTVGRTVNSALPVTL
jgi:hypothetical protein